MKWIRITRSTWLKNVPFDYGAKYRVSNEDAVTGKPNTVSEFDARELISLGCAEETSPPVAAEAPAETPAAPAAVETADAAPTAEAASAAPKRDRKTRA